MLLSGWFGRKAVVEVLEPRRHFSTASQTEVLNPTTEQGVLADDGATQSFQVTLAEDGWLSARVTAKDNQLALASVEVSGAGFDMQSGYSGAGVGVNLIEDENAGNLLKAGNYQVIVRRQDIGSHPPSPMSFTLSLLADYAGSTVDLARDLGVLTSSITLRGFVGNAPSIANARIDMNRFHLAAAGEVSVTTDSSDQTARFLLLVNGAFKPLETASAASGIGTTFTAQVPEGEVYLELTRQSGGGAYLIELSTHIPSPSVQLSTLSADFGGVPVAARRAGIGLMALTVTNVSTFSETVTFTTSAGSRFGVEYHPRFVARLGPSESRQVNLSFNNGRPLNSEFGQLPLYTGEISVEWDDTEGKQAQTIHTSAHLEPIVTNPRSIHYEDYSAYQLFGGDSLPKIQQTHQHVLGDCYLISVLGALAYKYPGYIAGTTITPDNDTPGTFKVQFFKNGNPVTLHIDGYLPVGKDGKLAYDQLDGSNAIWAALLEKAYAVFRNSAYSYPNLQHRGSQEGGVPDETFEALVAKAQRFPTYFVNKDNKNIQVKKTIFDALEKVEAEDAAGHAVIMTTPSPPPKFNGDPLYSDHGYVVTAVDGVNRILGLASIQVRNPWGDPTEPRRNSNFVQLHYTFGSINDFKQVNSIVTGSIGP